VTVAIPTLAAGPRLAQCLEALAAQTLAGASRIDEAKRMLVDGIASARRTGNTHAQSEMTAMLEELVG